MLTPDTMLDRRILLEAESLISNGWDVLLLSAKLVHQEAVPNTEMIGRVPIIRVVHDWTDPRHRWLDCMVSAVSTILHHIRHFLSLYISRLESSPDFSQKRILLIALLTIRTLVFTSIRLWQRIATNTVFRIKKIFARLSRIDHIQYKYFLEGLKLRPDVVHVHDLPVLGAGVELKKRLNVPLIFDSHEFYTEQLSIPARARKKLKKLEAHFMKNVDILIAVNPMATDVFKAWYPGTRVRCIQNSTNYSSTFDPDFSYNRFREDIPEIGDRKILLYQGWICDERNLEHLVESLAFMKSDWVLVLMGYGEYQGELKAIAKTISCEDRVFIVDAKSQEDLLSYSNSADLGVIPYSPGRDLNSKFASPNKLYEFIAAGLPIISNDLIFIKSITLSNNIGCVVNMTDPKNTATAINNISDQCLEQWQKNIKKIRPQMLWEREQDKLFAIYEEIFRLKDVPSIKSITGYEPNFYLDKPV